MKRKNPIKRRGKKTDAWETAKPILKAAFEKAGITRCECCGADNFLSWAHSKKRRNIPTESPLLFEVALLCTMSNPYHSEGCHQFFENSGEWVMYFAIRDIISTRKTPVVIPL